MEIIQIECDLWHGFLSLYYFLNSVCNAGHYKNGNNCEMCTGNTIKSTIGDAADCNADTPCDGVTEVPDANYTNCGL